MKAPVILAIDIGSSALKAAHIDTSGRLLALARVEYEALRMGGPGGDFFKSPRSDHWELALEKALAALGDRDAQAVCVSGNGPTLVPVTAAGESLSPLHWYENRPLDIPSLFLPQVVRLREERPEDFKRTARLFSAQDWLAWRLGAEPVTTLPGNAYRAAYWDASQCAALGIEPGLFPPFAPMGSVIGRLRGGGGEEKPIVAGGPDFLMALIGVGAIEPGIACDRAGSSEGINLCVEKKPAPAPGIRVLPGAVEGRWNLGMLVGPPPDDLGRAVGTLRAAGYAVDTLRISGGQGKDPALVQEKADRTGCTMLVPEIVDGELAGDAALGSVALGEAADLFEAVHRMVRFSAAYVPGGRGRPSVPYRLP